jgi:hypothetical protein
MGVIFIIIFSKTKVFLSTYVKKIQNRVNSLIFGIEKNECKISILKLNKLRPILIL